MCGIFATTEQGSVEKTMDALRFLQYRGYDSAGIAIKNQQLSVVKTVGKIDALQEKLKNVPLQASLAMGHTRWATHGEVSLVNAHPFLSADGNFAVCHNGIIENYRSLAQMLEQNGLQLASETDSEVVAHLLQFFYKGDVLQAVQKTVALLKGTFALLILCNYDNKIYAVRYKSPLVASISPCGVSFCSDFRFAASMGKVAAMPDGCVAVAQNRTATFLNFDGAELCLKFEKAIVDVEGAPQGDAMLKEILEIPLRVKDAVQNYSKNGGLPCKMLRKLRRIYLVGCGTAFNSGAAACAAVRSFLHLDLLPVVASEFVYDQYPIDCNTLALCISQSGETADTVRAAEKLTASGAYVVAVTNTPVSSLGFACHRVLNVFAGAEFSVASTKAYNCQLVTLVLLLADVALIRGEISLERHRTIFDAATKLPLVLEQTLNLQKSIEQLAERIKDSSAVFFLGRGRDYPTAAEASLKLKEITYIHSEAYPSGELKHGTLALMEKGVSAVVISTVGNLVDKNQTTAREIASRGAAVVMLSPFGGTNAISLPVVHDVFWGVISVVPLQLLAYFVAKKLGRDVDKPRNLAKSVTVE